MANKLHPGAFRCYEAALPDEPMFVILGRDPAGPATLRFWAQERINTGKTQGEDAQRISASLIEAEEMAAWRAQIVRHAEEMGEPPAWKLPRPEEHGDDKPVRVIAADPALGAPYGGYDNRLHTHRELMVSVGKEVREIAHALTEMYPDPRNGSPLIDIVARLHAEVERLAEAARAIKLSDTDPYVEFARNLGKPVEHVWYDTKNDPESEYPIVCKPLSFTRMSELLDYATAYGEFDETTPDGTTSKHGDSMTSPMNAERRAAIWIYKRCMGILPEGAEPPVAAVTPPTALVHAAGLFRVPNVREPQTMEQIAETYALAAKPVPKAPVIDSAPDDLAHAPEVPHHRFSVFHTDGDYAYARGLEVNPMHLPTALNAMAKSGWHLCAIFGQTDAQHIGFIFRRDTLPPRDWGFEIAHGLHGGFDTSRPRGDEDSTVSWPKDFKGTATDGERDRAKEASLLSECPEGDEECLRRIGLGRGLMP